MLEVVIVDCTNKKIKFDLVIILQNQYTNLLTLKIRKYFSKITPIERKIKQIA